MYMSSAKPAAARSPLPHPRCLVAACFDGLQEQSVHNRSQTTRHRNPSYLPSFEHAYFLPAYFEFFEVEKKEKKIDFSETDLFMWVLMSLDFSETDWSSIPHLVKLKHGLIVDIYDIRNTAQKLASGGGKETMRGRNNTEVHVYHTHWP